MRRVVTARDAVHESSGVRILKVSHHTYFFFSFFLMTEDCDIGLANGCGEKCMLFITYTKVVSLIYNILGLQFGHISTFIWSFFLFGE